MSETEFSFDLPKTKTAAEKKLDRANAAELRRFKAKAETEAAAERTKYRKSPLGKLDRYFEDEWTKASEEEKAVVLAQHETAMQFIREISDTIAGIRDGRIAGQTMLWPDLLYTEISEYLREFPLIHRWITPEVAANDAEALANCDDQYFQRFGKQTRISDFLWSELQRHVLSYCRTHPNDCDAEVWKELETTVRTNFPTPAPATPAGYPTLTKAEENGLASFRKHVQKVKTDLAKMRGV